MSDRRTDGRRREMKDTATKHLKTVLDDEVAPRPAMEALHRELSDLLSRRRPAAS